jgi:hypothetical protein
MVLGGSCGVGAESFASAGVSTVGDAKGLDLGGSVPLTESCGMGIGVRDPDGVCERDCVVELDSRGLMMDRPIL